MGYRNSGLPLLFIFALLLAPTAQARPTITFSCALVSDSQLEDLLEGLYRQAFDQLGYDFVLQRRPGKRSLAEVQQGHTDGECARYGLLNQNQTYENLVKVDAKLVTFTVSLFSYRTDLPAITLHNLAHHNLRIGYQRGTVAIDNLLAHLPEQHIIQVNDLHQGLRMLAAERIDALCVPPLLLQAALAKYPMEREPRNIGVLARFGAYPYLQSTLAPLAQPLAMALAEILADPAHPLHTFSE
jgi:ABC-type amino acid transport substrate-binding protein